eukprot:7540927-Karenia_brevis.AAC.1
MPSLAYVVDRNQSLLDVRGPSSKTSQIVASRDEQSLGTPVFDRIPVCCRVRGTRSIVCADWIPHTVLWRGGRNGCT